MKSAGKARSNGLYRHIRTSKEIIRNLLNYFIQKIIQPDALSRHVAFQRDILNLQKKEQLFLGLARIL